MPKRIFVILSQTTPCTVNNKRLNKLSPHLRFYTCNAGISLPGQYEPGLFYIIHKCTGDLAEGGITMLRECLIKQLRFACLSGSCESYETPRKIRIFQGNRSANASIKSRVERLGFFNEAKPTARKNEVPLRP